MTLDRSNEAKKQLYTLIPELEKYIPHKEELGQILGYVVLNRLLKVSASRFQSRGAKRAEVQLVHRGLSSLLNICRNYSREGTEDNIGERVLQNLQEEYKAEFRNIMQNQDVSPASPLTRDIVKVLRKKKNYADYLRISGINLIDEVKASSALWTYKDIVSSDYNFLKSSFVEISR